MDVGKCFLKPMANTPDRQAHELAPTENTRSNQAHPATGVLLYEANTAAGWKR